MRQTVFATVTGPVADEIAKNSVQSNLLCCRCSRQQRSGLGLQDSDYVCRHNQGFVFGSLIRVQLAVIGKIGQFVHPSLHIGIGPERHKPTGNLGGQCSPNGVQKSVEQIRVREHNNYSISLRPAGN